MAGVAVIWLVIIGTSIWVAIDASNIGARKGLVKGVAHMGPAGWFFCSLLIWIVGFPVYLAKRSEIKAAVAGSNIPTSAPIPVTQTSQNPSPPPGWYPSPPLQAQHPTEEGTGSGFTSKADELVKLPWSAAPSPIPGFAGSTGASGCAAGTVPSATRVPAAPCVLSRTWNWRDGSVVITFLGAPGYFWGSA